MLFYNKNFKTYINFPDTIMHANMKFNVHEKTELIGKRLTRSQEKKEKNSEPK